MLGYKKKLKRRKPGLPVELDEIKVEHERIKAHHETYKKREKITSILVYISLAALVLVLLFFSVVSSQASPCDTVFCALSPWIIIGLFILCVIFFALAAKHKERGINAYRRAMGILNSLHNTK